MTPIDSMTCEAASGGKASHVHVWALKLERAQEVIRFDALRAAPHHRHRIVHAAHLHDRTIWQRQPVSLVPILWKRWRRECPRRLRLSFALGSLGGPVRRAASR